LALIEGVGAVYVEAHVEAGTDGFGGAASVVEKFAARAGASGKIQQKGVINVNHSSADPINFGWLS
jgi:hypothetical protein